MYVYNRNTEPTKLRRLFSEAVASNIILTITKPKNERYRSVNEGNKRKRSERNFASGIPVKPVQAGYLNVLPWIITLRRISPTMPLELGYDHFLNASLHPRYTFESLPINDHDFIDFEVLVRATYRVDARGRSFVDGCKFHDNYFLRRTSATGIFNC